MPRTFIVLLASAALVVAVGAAHGQLACEDPQLVELTAGVADNFAPPTEPASPSAELQAFLGAGPAPVFDHSTTNRTFGHTFTGIPTGVVAAQLTIRLRSLGEISDNDSLSLELLPGATFRWSQRISVLANDPWDSNGDQATLVLDLENLSPSPSNGVTNVLSALADGDLDVYVQDDTTVDFMTLRITHCPPPPPCATPPWSMVGWWPLDETSGTTAADVAANNDGIHTNGPVPAAGWVAGALSFDGVDDFVSVPDNSLLDIGTKGLTIDAWVFADKDTLIKPIVDKMDLATGAGYSLSLVAGNAMTFAWGDASGFTFTHSSSGTPIGNPAVPVGVWTHVAVTLERGDPAGGRFYINGALVNTFNGALKPGSFASAAPLRIGAGGIFNNGFFDGLIDELEVFERALDGSEIQALFEAGHAGKCKTSVHVGWDTDFCAGQSTAIVEPEVCNNSAVPQSYLVSFTGLAAAVLGCQVDGPTGFQIQPPATLPLLVPPQSCRSFDVRVNRPAFTANGDQSCFRVTAQSTATGQSVSADGSVWDQRDFCVVCERPEVVDIPVGRALPIPFDVTNTSGATRTLRYQFSAMASDRNPANQAVSLNGLPPGTAVDGEVTIPAGQSRTVAVEASMASFQSIGTHDLLLSDRDNGSVLESTGLRSFATGCTPNATTLCLNAGRVRVNVAWKDFVGNTGLGQAVALTNDTGYFWFFSPTNVELVLKVLDGRPINDHFWVFYGALSTVEYVITVTDTETGASKTFVNPSGNLASVADVEALPGSALAGLAADHEPSVAAAEAWSDFADTLADLGKAGTCASSPTGLCLNDNRFRVEVQWKDFAGNTGTGQAVPLTSDTGYFWFFGADNVELILKILDGTPLNQHWWVFYGALSSVEYKITVTDTMTGAVKTYENPSGNLGSVADTNAFPE